MKLEKKIQALALRRKGASIKEVSRKLGVAQSTVSVWSRSIELPTTARRILRKKAEQGRVKATLVLRQRTESKLQEAATAATQILDAAAYNRDSLKVLCALLYWCEGSKTKNDGALTFTNSDPELMSFFLRILRQAFVVDESKFRVLMHLHGYHDASKQLRFWSKVTNIQPTQFLRTYQKVHNGKQKKDGYAGCISLRYHDVVLAREIQALARIAMKPGPIV